MRTSRRFLLIALLLMGMTTQSRADRPADSLLELAPSDAALTVVVEKLSDRWPEFVRSSMGKDFQTLPAYQLWLATSGSRQLAKARRDVEAVLGVDLEQARDGLLGEAIVLVLRPDPAGPEAASGLLLTRVGDRDLLNRLIETINRSEREAGQLRELIEEHHAGSTFHVRKFAPDGRPDEAYAILDGGIFAWSNSIDLIHGVLERAEGVDGLADDPAFRLVRQALPDDALAALFIDPKTFPAIVEEADPNASGDPFGTLVQRYLDAIRYFGASIRLRDGLEVQTHEIVDPSQIDEPIRRWAARPGDASGLIGAVPSDPVVIAVGQIDLGAAVDELATVLDAESRVRLDTFFQFASGISMGLDARSDVLPALGPGALAYLVRDEESGKVAVVAAVELGGGERLAQVIENGLRTLLSLAALDPKRSSDGALVERIDENGVRLLVLRGRKLVLACHVEPGLLALSNSIEAVGAFVSDRRPLRGGELSPFQRDRDRYFPEARTFAYADLKALVRIAQAERNLLADRLASEWGLEPETARRDLEQVLALLNMFRAAYVTRAVDDGFHAVHHTIGLLQRDEVQARP